MTRKLSHFKNTLISKVFQSKVKWRFSFCGIFFCSREIQVFLLCKFSHWWRHRLWKYGDETRISANNEAMLLKLCRDVAPYKICQMVHILMLLWQHARFQSPVSSKLNITICVSTRQNAWCYLRCMPVPPSI